MRHPKAGAIPHVEVKDGVAAFHKLEEFTRRVMAVPKMEIDAMLARERSKKNRKPR
jgi:hypothetical protein